jgi:hypothetical protein
MLFSDFVKGATLRNAATSINMTMADGVKIKGKVEGVIVSSLHPSDVARAVEKQTGDISFQATGHYSNGKRTGLGTRADMPTGEFAERVRTYYGVSVESDSEEGTEDTGRKNKGRNRGRKPEGAEVNGQAEGETVGVSV